MRVVQTPSELRALLKAARREGKEVAFVPTMGCLHEGHLALIQAAKRSFAFVVVSIFVNPTQFVPGEDLDAYPRPFKKDTRLASFAGADLLFAPSVETMYPDTPRRLTWVNVESLPDRLCGKGRPGHFRGMCTVVAKLFNLVQPDAAFFGEKDYQQLTIVKQMVKELLWPIQIVGIPTVREYDGLAMSSRNSYLSPKERTEAPLLYAALNHTQAAFLSGERDPQSLLGIARKHIEKSSLIQLVYLELLNPNNLETIKENTGNQALLVVAAQLGKTRLIDNLRFDQKSD